MSEHVCPVCGGTEWVPDFHSNDEGDEMRVDHCENCDWPPDTPMSPDEYRAMLGDGKEV